jgi:hypothetical protein
MLQIILHYLKSRTGLPALILGMILVFSLDKLVFIERTAIDFYMLILIAPYFEIFGKSSNSDLSNSALSLSIPVSFNILWMAKYISFYILSTIAILLQIVLRLDYFGNVWHATEGSIHSYILMYFLLFLLSKWKYRKLGHVKVLSICFGLFIIFGFYTIHFYKLINAVSSCTGIDREHPVLLLMYLLPISVISILDFVVVYFAKRYKVNL